MVCHPLPPPLPPWGIVPEMCYSLSLNGTHVTPLPSEARQEDYLQPRGHFRALRSMFPGFTITPELVHENTRPWRGRQMQIIRTVEEGWVAVDILTKRWKRLGWWDWIDIKSGQDKERRARRAGCIKIIQILTKIRERSAQAIEMGDSGDCWIWGSEGWRYETTTPVSYDTLQRLQQERDGQRRTSSLMDSFFGFTDTDAEYEPGRVTFLYWGLNSDSESSDEA